MRKTLKSNGNVMMGLMLWSFDQVHVESPKIKGRFGLMIYVLKGHWEGAGWMDLVHRVASRVVCPQC